MGYTKQNGVWAGTEDVVLIPPGTVVSADGVGEAVELGAARVLRLALDVAALGGDDPTLDVTIQTSPTGAEDSWYTAGVFTQATADGVERKLFLCDRFVRASYNVEGEDSGSLSAVTQDGAGPAVTVSGTPAGDYELVIEITLAGARGTAEFRWSLDGGDTWEEEDVVTSASDALGSSGITALFGTGTDYEDGTTYSVTADDPDADTEATFSVRGEAA